MRIKERVRAQIRAGGEEPNDARIFERMVEVLDNAVAFQPLPDGATPDAIMMAIHRCLDLGRRSLDSADHLEALFKTQFPAEYAASARGEDPKERQGDTPAVDQKEAGAATKPTPAP